MQLIDTYQKSLIIRNYRPATLRKNVQIARRFLRSVDFPKNINAVAVERYLIALSDAGRSIKTMKNHLTAIKLFCDYLCRHSVIKENPVGRFPSLNMPEDVPICLSNSEIATVYRIGEDLDMSCEFTLALRAGLRMSELRDLLWSDVDIDRRQLLVRHSKSKRPRSVPLHKSAVNQLKIQKERFGDLVFVFPGGTGGPGMRNVWNLPIRRGVNWWCRKSIRPLQREIPALQDIAVGSTCRGWHALRHTFATRAVKAGIDLVTIRDWLGHRKIETTMKYVHIARHYDQRIETV